jgi:hypothetical protein
MLSTSYEGSDVAGNKALCNTIVFVPKNANQPNPPGAAAAAAETENEGVAEPAPVQPVDDATTVTSIYLPLITAQERATQGNAEKEEEQPEQLQPSSGADLSDAGSVMRQIFLPLVNQ